MDNSVVATEGQDVSRKDYLIALRSQFRRYLAHWLKWYGQPERRCRSWQLSMVDAQRQAQDMVVSARIKPAEIEEAFQKAYPAALRLAIKETGLPQSVFPKELPLNWQEVMVAPKKRKVKKISMDN